MRDIRPQNDGAVQTSRRRLALAGLALGAAAVSPARAQGGGPGAAPAPVQTRGPTVLHGLSPRLTVHAIDSFHGTAGAGLQADFSRWDGQAYVRVKSLVLNAAGRTDEPLLIGDSYAPGRYELLLHVDQYFERLKATLPRPAWLSKVPVRFQVVDASERIHLPIQFGPWSYTYSRGS